MTTAADEAGAALKASMAINREQQVLTEESRLLLAAMLRDEMRVAVAEGIAAALTDENAERFWSKGLEVLQRQAREQTGRFVLDGITAVVKRALWIGLFVVVAYSMGGWSLVKTVWAAVNAKG